MSQMEPLPHREEGFGLAACQERGRKFQRLEGWDARPDDTGSPGWNRRPLPFLWEAFALLLRKAGAGGFSVGGVALLLR